MNNPHFNDSSLTVNTDEFIDLDTALLEEELRSLNATPEYNRISLKSIDAQEAERIRRSLVTPIPSSTPELVASPRLKHAISPDLRSFSKSPTTDSVYAESIALFRNLNDQDTTILDFASSNLDDIMKSIEMEDNVSIIDQEATDSRRKTSVSQNNNIIARPSYPTNVCESRGHAAKRPITNRYSIDVDGLTKLHQQQQQNFNSLKHRASSAALMPIETSITQAARPVAVQKTVRKIPSKVDDNNNSKQNDKRRWSSYTPEQHNNKQQAAPLTNKLASSMLNSQTSTLRTLKRANAINTTPTTATKKPINTAVRRMSSQSLENKHAEEKADQYNQRLALLNRSENPTTTLRKRASVHGYNLLKQQEQQVQDSRNAAAAKSLHQSENDKKLQRRHTVRIATASKDRATSSSIPVVDNNHKNKTSNYNSLINRKKRLSFQETLGHAVGPSTYESTLRPQQQVSSLQIAKKEAAAPTVTQQYQRRQRALSVPESHSNLQLNIIAEDQYNLSTRHGAAGAVPSSIRHRSSMREPQQMTASLLSLRNGVSHADQLPTFDKNRTQQSSDLHVLPSESSSGLSNSSASSSSYSSGRGPRSAYHDPPTPPTHASIITSAPAYSKRNSMPMMTSRDITGQQPLPNSNKADYYRYSHHLSRIAEVNTAPSSEGYAEELHDIFNISPPPAVRGALDQKNSDRVHYLQQEEEEVYNNYDATSPVYQYKNLPRQQQRTIPVTSEENDRHYYSSLPRRQRVISEDNHTHNNAITHIKRYNTLPTKYHSTTTTLNNSQTVSNGYHHAMRSAMADSILPTAVPVNHIENVYRQPDCVSVDYGYNDVNQPSANSKRLSRKVSAEYVTDSAKKVLASIHERRKRNEAFHHSQQQQTQATYYTR